MDTYLLAWNPENFVWTTFDADIEKIGSTGYVDSWWSTVTKSIEVGSKFFLMRVGGEPRGLIGYGTITSEPREVPHWDPSRAALGETYHRVDIRFESLRRTPLVRRIELEYAPFKNQKWDPQGSGIEINSDIADHLRRLWSSRLGGLDSSGYHLPNAILSRWREHLAAWRTQKDLVEGQEVRDRRRVQILPEFKKLISDFVEGRITLPEFRVTLDKKTRNEWDVFGVKGLSGAGYLNRLIKRISAAEELRHQLQVAIRAPSTPAEARLKLDGFLGYLDRVIDKGDATVGNLQPNRSYYFLSVLWHVQQPDVWPALYDSARTALQENGLQSKVLFGGDAYLEFVALYRALEAALALRDWQLEHVFAFVAGEGDAEPGPGENLETDQRVWLYAPGPGASNWESDRSDGIAAIDVGGVGDLSDYEDLDEIHAKLVSLKGGNPFHDARCCFEFSQVMQPGDLVIAKQGAKRVVGYGYITSAYRFDSAKPAYQHVRDIDWKHSGEWEVRDKPLVTKTLTNIGNHPSLVSRIKLALGITDSGGLTPKRPAPTYTIANALQDLFLSESWLQEQLALLKHRKNIVLQGPPGVGKTYVAKRLAYLLLGEKDLSRVRFVQFHPSYSYEDFIQGYRPRKAGGFERVDGTFYNFCDEALQNESEDYVFVIDEINRGNLSKIFGELLMLLEADKRSKEWAVHLTYGRDEEDEPFHIPPNVHVIGTMNTADRSLALVDYALRRRFAFVDVPPALDSPRFDDHLASLNVPPTLRQRLRERVAKLNETIRKDTNLGEGFCIGHSYFCNVAKGEGDVGDPWYERIIDTEIGPLLREYWFDDKEKAESELMRLLDKKA